MRVEISVESVAGVRVARDAGADRVELCAGLDVGGLTPGAGLVEAAVAESGSTEVHVLVRPRPGGFRYSRDEVDVMLRDVAVVRRLGAAGVVIGALDDLGEVDPVCAAFLDTAGGMATTFHRAIDVCADSRRTFDRVAELGFTRVLTSGRRRSVLDGAPLIRALVERGGAEVMACGGVRAENAARVVAATGVRDLHGAVRSLRAATPTGDVDFGGHHETDAAGVAALCAVRNRVPSSPAAGRSAVTPPPS